MMSGMKSMWLMIMMLFTTLAGCASSSTSSAAATSGSVRTADGECTVVGSWIGQVPAGILQGRTLTMVFSEDGTAQGTCDRFTLNSRWQRNGNLVEVIDVSATPAFARCDPNLVGRYTLEFGEDCQSVLTLNGEDTCNHRRLALLNFRASRQ